MLIASPTLPEEPMTAVDIATGEAVEIHSVHPVAELFPMLAGEDLTGLVADIEANGLIHPLVVTPAGELLDGRNRLEACRRLKVDPMVEVFDGDPVGYILSANVARRNLNRGQAAMIALNARFPSAEIALDEEKLAQLKKQLPTVSERRFQDAATVRRWAPQLVDDVMAGTVTIDVALKEARDTRAAKKSGDAQLAELHEKAPDLADAVTEQPQRLTLREAWGAWRARQEESEKNRRVATRLLADVIIPLAQLRGFVEDTADRYDPELADPGREVTLERIEDAQDVLQQLADLWRKAGT